WKSFQRYGTYPIFVVVGVSTVLAGIRAGYHPFAVIAVVHLIGAGITEILERLYPWTEDWNHPKGDRAVDLIHAAVSNIGFLEVFKAVVLGALVLVSAKMSAALGVTLWPHHWPLLAQMMLGVLIGDFFFHFGHQYMHENDFGWSFHVAHHSAERLYWLNGLRTHPFNSIVSFGCFQLPLVLLGANEAALAATASFIATHGLLQHSNIDLRLGFLNKIFSGPELHRWHHSRVVEEANSNYGNCISVWDVVLGTWFMPADREPPKDVGIQGMPNYPMHSWWAQVRAPFEWKRLKAEAQALTGAPAPADAEFAAVPEPAVEHA
ncbi:MAG: sterol desaturase family protein, partial [Myxococcales bacterium]|nr:sterol desaturase family protein [Myxococcales bacterium]